MRIWRGRRSCWGVRRVLIIRIGMLFSLGWIWGAGFGFELSWANGCADSYGRHMRSRLRNFLNRGWMGR